MASGISASTIVRLLREKHSSDVFVDECKDGPTWSGTHSRMDAWVMPRSWTKSETTGYEIKVSRSDFLRDDKWPGYLPLCHRFYFVAPPDVIQLAEVPVEAGLMVTTKNGTRLLTKKKAPTRTVEIPESLWRYVLMSRVRVTSERSLDPVEVWRRWLAEKDEQKHLGWNVSRSIRRIVEERIDAVKKENNRLRAQNEMLAGAREILERAGIKTLDDWNTKEAVARKVREIAAETIPADIARDVETIIARLSDARDRLGAIARPGGA